MLGLLRSRSSTFGLFERPLRGQFSAKNASIHIHVRKRVRREIAHQMDTESRRIEGFFL